MNNKSINYIAHFKPYIWLCYYFTLCIFINLSKTNSFWTIFLFIALYFILAVSQTSLNYKLITTNLLGKGIYWSRFIVKIILYLIVSHLQFEVISSLGVILCGIGVELGCDIFLLTHRHSIYDMKTFWTYQTQKFKLITPEELQRWQRYLIYFIQLFCFMILLCVLFIPYRSLGYDDKMVVILLFTESVLGWVVVWLCRKAIKF